MTERLFRTVKDILHATAHSTGKKWTEVLPLIREPYDVQDEQTESLSSMKSYSEGKCLSL